MEYKILNINFNKSYEQLEKVVKLQNIVYGDSHLFNIDSFIHRYLNNPLGDVISFNALYKNDIVAHYACIPIKMKIDGCIYLGLLDIATVTHPEHRGKGLFKKLAKATFDYAKEHGFKFILGIANANSYPGYMKYFDFKFISQLDVKIGIGNNITIPEKQFSVYWDKESIEWRLKCGKANYYNTSNSILGKFKLYIDIYMGTFDSNFISSLNYARKSSSISPLKLYVGLGAEIKSTYFTVPKFIKHSPFNLIFLDLTDGMLPEPNKDNFVLQLIDFDVA